MEAKVQDLIEKRMSLLERKVEQARYQILIDRCKVVIERNESDYVVKLAQNLATSMGTGKSPTLKQMRALDRAYYRAIDSQDNNTDGPDIGDYASIY